MVIFIPLGIIAAVFQLVILREFSFSIAKNELAFVVSAGFWIISCSLGSVTNIPKKLRELPLPLSLSITFSLSVSLIHLAKSLIGLKYYDTLSLGLVLLLGIFLIGPTAFIIGFAFRRFTQEQIRNNPLGNNIYGKFFAFEAVGFFLGGLAFTFYFSSYANPLVFSLLPLLILPNVKNPYKKALFAALVITITIITLLSFDSILKKEFNNSDTLSSFASRYGPIISTRKAGVTTLFSEGSLLATSEDRSANEEFIHISLSAADRLIQKDLLFIGTAVTGQIKEILKYNINSLDCLQINPLISKLTQKGLPAGSDNKINLITDDPRLYLKNKDKRYDVILMNVPAPSNIALNRYFTEDFFKLIANRLNPKGIFSFTIPSKREILSPQFIRFNSSITNAINKVFANSLIIPSDSMIIIASDKQKLDDYYLLDNFTKTKPETAFFTIYHFKDYLTPSARNYTQNLLDRKIAVNTDINPSGFLNYLILEQIKTYPNLKISFEKTQSIIKIILYFLGIIIIIASFLSKKASSLLNIGAIGFTSIGLNSIIFILFQSYCGALFWKLGLLVAFFMAGLSIGTFFMNKIKTYCTHALSGLYLFWTVLIFILFLNLKTIGGLNYAEVIFYLYFLICGFLTGSSYPLLADNLLINKFHDKNIATTIYSADLIGAFLGTLACGILFIPFLGIPHSLLTLILLNVIFTLKNLRN